MPERSDAQQRLIAAAQRLFHARGYAAVGVQEIADAAEVRRGSFYYYFASKEELALAALEADWRSLRREVYEPAFLDERRDPLERFQRWVELADGWYSGRARLVNVMGGCPIGNLGQELSTSHPAVRSRVEEIFDEAAGFFQGGLDAALAAGEVDSIPGDAGRRVLAYIQGVLLLGQTSDDPAVVGAMGLDPIGVSGAVMPSDVS